MVECEAHVALAREAAEKSIVLLQNEGDLLPLATTAGTRIAVVGDRADAINLGDRGSSMVTSSSVSKPLDGIRALSGEAHVEPHKHWTWAELITHMTQYYPHYLDEFEHLEDLAPVQDQPLLRFLTQHEVAAIEFARRELAGDAHSTDPLQRYLAEPPPRLARH